jgi:glycosyltransferase involved in cell wall biosynthesis
VSDVGGPPSVSVCFPAYNEELTISGVLEEAHALLSGSSLDYEILVCDDGSRDGTGAAIDLIAARRPRIRVLRHAANRGIRETFEHLYHESRKEFVFLNSTDGQWDTRVLFDLLPLAGEWDVIIASRRDKHYRFGRRFVSWGFNQIPRMLYGVTTTDAGAVKLVRREIIERFELVSRSPFSEAERLIRAARAGYRITARVTDTSPRRSGKSRGVSPRLVLEALRDVVRVRRTLGARSAGARSMAESLDERTAESSNADQS